MKINRHLVILLLIISVCIVSCNNKPKEKDPYTIITDTPETIIADNDYLTLVADITYNVAPTQYLQANRQCPEPKSEDNYFLYEDEKYYITAECHGEFGGIAYFRDKATDITYETAAICPTMVLPFQDKYYITTYLGHLGSHSAIIEIGDPTQLRIASKEEHNYAYMKENEEALFVNDTRKNLLNEDGWGTRIRATFVHKGRLLHMYLKDGESFFPALYSPLYIGEIRDDKLVPIYTFGHEIYPILEHQLPDGSFYLSFTTGKGKTSGLIRITPEKINIHYMLNK